MPPQKILISLRYAPLHQDILHRWLDKRKYSIYTEKGKRANEQPLLPQSHFSAVDCFYRVFFAEPNEQLDVEGGVIGTICAVIGTALAIGTAIYGYGYAKGQQAGYRAKYGN